jgi:tetrahydromethanopterin S-methyltransferase subunit B
MLSNNFWYGFLMGAGLVLLIAFVSLLLARVRAKNSANSS